LFITKLLPQNLTQFSLNRNFQALQKGQKNMAQEQWKQKEAKKGNEKVTISSSIPISFLLFSSHANVSSGRRFHSIIVCECVCGCYIQ